MDISSCNGAGEHMTQKDQRKTGRENTTIKLLYQDILVICEKKIQKCIKIANFSTKYLMLNPLYVLLSVSKRVFNAESIICYGFCIEACVFNAQYIICYAFCIETCVFNAEFILCYAFCIETCKLGFFFSCHILGLIHSCLIHSIVQ